MQTTSSLIAPDPATAYRAAGRWDMGIQTTNRMTVDVPGQAQDGFLCVRMSGDVDITEDEELALAGTRIRGPGAHTIFLDVGPVTFFGSTLLNFLVHLVNTAPGGQIVLCRASPMARRVVAAMELPSQISLRPDLPPEWVEPPPAWLREHGRVSKAAS